jgi:hypothetical protein
MQEKVNFLKTSTGKITVLGGGGIVGLLLKG